MSLAISAFVAVGAVMAIVIVTVGYHAAPFRAPPAVKPRFQLYPKYRFGFRHREVVLNNLAQLGFEPAGDAEPGLFVRGVALGDPTSQPSRLNVRLAASRNEAVIYAPGAGIIFDTGDLWTLANDLVTE